MAKTSVKNKKTLYTLSRPYNTWPCTVRIRKFQQSRINKYDYV